MLNLLSKEKKKLSLDRIYHHIWQVVIIIYSYIVDRKKKSFLFCITACFIFGPSSDDE